MPKKNKKEIFKVGVNLAPLKDETEERRYEEGDEVPDLTKDERVALKGAIGHEEEE